MRKPAARFSLLLACLMAVALWSPATASAQMREFTGRIDTVSKKKMIIDNRKGDKVSFVWVEETVVEGEKAAWGKLKKKDWVTVSWKMIDKPRKAYKVVVLPPKKDDE
ncbi:MAG: hypothetical protein V3T07_08505 [Myxococcota bacterium]